MKKKSLLRRGLVFLQTFYVSMYVELGLKLETWNHKTGSVVTKVC